MKNVLRSLGRCPLFNNIPLQYPSDLLNQITYSISNYSREQIIAVEGDECTKLGIVLKGSIEIKRVYATGKVITMARHIEGDIFGEVIIFSNINQYPATIVSITESSVLYISQEDILRLCSLFPQFLNNFMSLLSNRILVLNQRIKNLSYETIRQKVASYLLDQYSEQKTLTLTLPYSRKEMAEHLGIPRPSLSRELIHMKDDHLIDFYKNTFKIVNLNGLEECLFQ